MYKCNEDRMKDKINTFSRFGATGNGGITRYSLPEEALQARAEFKKRMEKTGAVIEIDDVRNIYATLEGTDKNAKRIVMGSHADSVKNGGNYDGILGVISAMEVLETIAEKKIPHKHPITVMIWTNEEGSLYPPAMMCSGIVCNDYLPEDIKHNFEYDKMMNSVSIEDRTTTFGEALEKSGYKGNKSYRLSRENALCMFETHIEQGPILEEAGNEIGVVDCVLGMFNQRIKFYGQTVHAGTFPMNKRKDAFFAAAQAILYLHEEIDKLGIKDLVYTTGEVVCHEWAGCRCETVPAWNRDTVYWDKKLVGYVEESAKELGVKYQYIHSGAGHDAQFVSYMIPTTMIFVQSKNGLSHCEEEYSDPKHCTDGATVMLNSVLKADVSE